MSTDSTVGEKFQEMVEIMARLRAPGGCPWDREQTSAKETYGAGRFLDTDLPRGN